MSDKIPKEVLDGLESAMEEAFYERQQRDFQYVVAYYLIKNNQDDKLLGYHQSTFCQLTDRDADGKRYAGEEPYEQLAIIRRNLDKLLEMEDPKDVQGLAGVFKKMSWDVKQKYFKDLKKEDVYIVAEYLDEGIAPQKFNWKVINEGNGE